MTATYTLGEYEVIQCTQCGEHQRGDQDEEVSVALDPTGKMATFRCTSCQEKEPGEM